jgi:hypothetical protein
VPTLDEYGDELYQLPPAQFVAARNAHVAALKKAGDKDLAARVAALRRPTTLGWVINLLALKRPDLVEGWLAFGEELRQAQTGLVGGEVRRLAADRRALLSELLDRASALAAEAGHSGPVPVNEISTTLTTALADPEVAAHLRTGRLLGAASYAGFGQSPEETWGEPTEAPRRPAPAKAPRTEREVETEDEGQDHDDTADEREAAAAALAEAQASVESARVEEADAKGALETLNAELAELEERVRAAQRRRGEATTARQDAERAVAAARQELRRLKR